ncbi:MAG: T9SS type A sorting domain-containing protein [Cyclobacteriaceae bacterium]|nr:T9SS type A sorting domain-containing protein [Cyclobacteriaceae bacterium]
MKKILTLLLFSTMLIYTSSATHLRCGYISVKRLSSTNLTCCITLTVFVSAGSPIAFGNGHLDFGDGSDLLLVPGGEAIIRPDLGPGIGVATFSIEHTFSGPGRYVIGYTEASRNGGIINFDSPLNTAFYIETSINLDPFLGTYNTPDFLVDPFFIAKTGVNLSLSIGAFSLEDFIVTYELSSPLREKGLIVSNYRLPDNFKVNPHNGLITWDTKYLDGYYAGEYLFAVKIHLSKYIDGNLYRLCTMLRDFQIILVDNEPEGILSDNSSLDENNRIYLSEGSNETIKVFYEPNTSENTTLNAYSALSENPDVFSFTTYDSAGADIKVGVLTLTSNSTIIRDNPYIITVRGAHRIESNLMYAADVVYMLYTRDLFPEIITRTEDTLAGITVTPNPVTDFLKVQLPHQQPAQLTLLDLSGKMMLKKFINESCVVDVRELPIGLYIIELHSGRARRTLKIIKD